MSVKKKIIGRDLPNGDYIEIQAWEGDGSDGLSAYFAVTCDGWEKRGTWSGRVAALHGRESTFGGSCHDLILSVAPELAPIVAVHLASLNGEPMHAVVNGWYFYSGECSTYERARVAAGENLYSENLKMSDHDRAARALRLGPDELPTGLDKQGFADFAESLKDRWLRDAAAAREVMAAMVDWDGVER
jgi:hypothetical protein